MNKIRLFWIPVFILLLGIGILLLGAMDMPRVEAARLNTWIPATSLPEPLAANLVQCPDDRDRFYMVGGIHTGDVTTDQLIRYDIAAPGVWVQLASMPQPLRAMAVTCDQGRIYVAGGLDSAGYLTDIFYIYDINRNAWTIGPQLPDYVWGAAMGAWDGKLYLIGGNKTGYPYTPDGSVDVFDLWTWEWTADGGQSMPEPASFFASAQAGSYLYAVGGYSGDFSHNVDQTQRYDMADNQWEVGPTFTSARALGTLAITSSHLYMLGGDLNGGTEFDATDLVEVLDISTWPNGTWTDLNDPLPADNLYPASTCSEVLSDGEIWGVGGVDADYNELDTNYYRPSEPCADFYFGDLTREEWELGNHPGAPAHYVLPVINNGTQPDTYDISVSGTWVITAPTTLGPIQPGLGDLLMVEVGVPEGPLPPPGPYDIAVVTVTSQGDPNSYDTAVLTTWITNWQESINLPQPLSFPTKAQCADDPNEFYIVGGANHSVNPIPTIYHFDGFEWTWVTNMPYANFGHAAVCYDHKLYVAGGIPSRLDVYDIDEDTWTALQSPLRYVWGAGMAAWDGQLFLVGGDNGTLMPTDEVDIYDIASDLWITTTIPMPVASFAYGNAQAGPYFYVVGGFSGDFNNNLNSTLRLNMATKVWDEPGPTFTSQRAITALTATQSHLYAYGGDINHGERMDTIGLVEALDLSQWPDGTWQDISQLMPWALEGNGEGFCTEAMTGGEIWSVGGMTGIWLPSGFVWVETIDNTYFLPIGEPCVQNILNLSDAPIYGEAEAGSTVTYTIDITNTGNIVDYYNLFVFNDWLGAKSLGGPGPVEPGEIIQEIIKINTPADAPPGTVLTSTVRVESQRDPNIMDSIQVFTTVLPTYKPQLKPETLELSGMYGELITYTLTVSNAGNITDTIMLTYTAGTWDVLLPVTSLELGMGESAEVAVGVTIPEDVQLGDTDQIDLIATSQGNPNKTDLSTLTTTAFWYRMLMPLTLKN